MSLLFEPPMRWAWRIARALGCNFLPTTLDRVPLVEGWRAFHSPGCPEFDCETLRKWRAAEAAELARGRETTAWALLPGSGRIAILGGDSPEWTARLLARQPTPLVVRSPTPGRAHLYYRWPDAADLSSKPNVAGPDTYDLKARGATCHAPGSLHHSRRGRYACELPDGLTPLDLERMPRGALAPMLPVLDLALVAGDAPERQRTWAESRTGEDVWSTDGEGERRMRGYLARVEPRAIGGRQAALYRLGLKAGDLGLPEPAARAMLLTWASACRPPIPEDEVAETVRRAYQARISPIGCEL